MENKAVGCAGRRELGQNQANKKQLGQGGSLGRQKNFQSRGSAKGKIRQASSRKALSAGGGQVRAHQCAWSIFKKGFVCGRRPITTPPVRGELQVRSHLCGPGACERPLPAMELHAHLAVTTWKGGQTLAQVTVDKSNITAMSENNPALKIPDKLLAEIEDMCLAITDQLSKANHGRIITLERDKIIKEAAESPVDTRDTAESTAAAQDTTEPPDEAQDTAEPPDEGQDAADNHVKVQDAADEPVQAHDVADGPVQTQDAADEPAAVRGDTEDPPDLREAAEKPMAAPAVQEAVDEPVAAQGDQEAADDPAKVSLDAGGGMNDHQPAVNICNDIAAEYKAKGGAGKSEARRMRSRRRL